MWYYKLLVYGGAFITCIAPKKYQLLLRFKLEPLVEAEWNRNLINIIVVYSDERVPRDLWHLKRENIIFLGKRNGVEALYFVPKKDKHLVTPSTISIWLCKSAD